MVLIVQISLYRHNWFHKLEYYSYLCHNRLHITVLIYIITHFEYDQIAWKIFISEK